MFRVVTRVLMALVAFFVACVLVLTGPNVPAYIRARDSQEEGGDSETSASDDSEEPEMDLEHLEAIIDEMGADVEGDGSVWRFTFNDVEMVCIADVTNDRMRIMTAIARMEDMTPEQAALAFDANFHTALDARYATNEGVLFSAFIHPLSPLTDGEARSAIEQVANLALTFGTTYQSGNLMFGL